MLVSQNPVFIPDDVVSFDADGLLAPCIPDDPVDRALWNTGIMLEKVKGFLRRWNQTVAYQQQGIFEIEDVPQGESLDFIQVDVVGKREHGLKEFCFFLKKKNNGKSEFLGSP